MTESSPQHVPADFHLPPETVVPIRSFDKVAPFLGHTAGMTQLANGEWPVALHNSNHGTEPPYGSAEYDEGFEPVD